MTNLPIAILMLTNVVTSEVPVYTSYCWDLENYGRHNRYCYDLHKNSVELKRIETTTITKQSVLIVPEITAQTWKAKPSKLGGNYVDLVWDYQTNYTHFTNLTLITNYTKTYVKVEKWEEEVWKGYPTDGVIGYRTNISATGIWRSNIETFTNGMQIKPN